MLLIVFSLIWRVFIPAFLWRRDFENIEKSVWGIYWRNCKHYQKKASTHSSSCIDWANTRSSNCYECYHRWTWHPHWWQTENGLTCRSYNIPATWNPQGKSRNEWGRGPWTPSVSLCGNLKPQVAKMTSMSLRLQRSGAKKCLLVPPSSENRTTMMCLKRLAFLPTMW